MASTLTHQWATQVPTNKSGDKTGRKVGWLDIESNWWKIKEYHLQSWNFQHILKKTAKHCCQQTTELETRFWSTFLQQEVNNSRLMRWVFVAPSLIARHIGTQALQLDSVGKSYQPSHRDPSPSRLVVVTATRSCDPHSLVISAKPPLPRLLGNEGRGPKQRRRRQRGHVHSCVRTWWVFWRRRCRSWRRSGGTHPAPACSSWTSTETSWPRWSYLLLSDPENFQVKSVKQNSGANKNFSYARITPAICCFGEHHNTTVFFTLSL